MTRIGMLGLGCLLAVSCATAPGNRGGKPNVEVYVSNQSTERPRVDIEVTVDGRKVASGVYPTASGAGVGYTGFRYPIVLAPGSHVLRAVSKAGGARLEKKLSIAAGKTYLIALGYEATGNAVGGHAARPRFELQVKAQAVYFTSSKGD